MSRALRLVRCWKCRQQFASKTALLATKMNDSKVHLCCRKCHDTQVQVNEQVAKVDAAFAKLEVIEESYRRNFGPILPVTER